MIKVVVIDDEPLVRLGLKQIIDWEGHGFKIVGEANNGQQGLELILETGPDIVMTDIKMPVMDGLKMMKMVFNAHYHPTFIILSSYDDFQLVKQAMKQGAEEYLIKLDLEPDSLLKTLATIGEKIDSERCSSEQVFKLENSFRENLNMLRESFFQRMINRPIPDRKEIDQQVKYLGIDLDENFLAAVSVRLNHLELLEKYDFAEYRSFEISILNTIDEIINDVFKGYTFTWNQGEFLSLISVDKILEWEPFNKKAKDMGERIIYMLKQYFNINISVGISNPHQGFDQLFQVYQESSQTVQYSYYSGLQEVLFYKELPDHHLTEPINTSEFRSILPQAIELYDPEMAQTVFDALIMNLQKSPVSRDQAQDVCFQIAYLIIGTGMSAEVLKTILDYNQSLVESILGLNTLSAIIIWLTHLQQNLCNFLAQNSEQKNHRLITKAKKYIAEHYNVEISLNELASAINISSGYLSTIFKQYTGICFTDYFTNFKIEEAKKMLRKSDYKIYEIADFLGYQNAYYFSKVFKKVTGMTPSEFSEKKF